MKSPETKIDFRYAAIVLLIILFSYTGYAQQAISMSETEGRREISMADASGKSTGGIYRYYAKGDDQPYTGILFAKYPNGNFQSWQEFENGIGQGKWINYYENGHFKEIGTYEKNKVQGPIKKYYRNGTIQADGQYKDWRIKVGTWKYYDERGALTITKDYGIKGSIEEVQQYYDRGEISFSWYSDILSKNGFSD